MQELTQRIRDWWAEHPKTTASWNNCEQEVILPWLKEHDLLKLKTDCFEVFIKDGKEFWGIEKRREQATILKNKFLALGICRDNEIDQTFGLEKSLEEKIKENYYDYDWEIRERCPSTKYKNKDTIIRELIQAVKSHYGIKDK